MLNIYNKNYFFSYFIFHSLIFFHFSFSIIPIKHSLNQYFDLIYDWDYKNCNVNLINLFFLGMYFFKELVYCK